MLGIVMMEPIWLPRTVIVCHYIGLILMYIWKMLSLWLSQSRVAAQLRNLVVVSSVNLLEHLSRVKCTFIHTLEDGSL